MNSETKILIVIGVVSLAVLVLGAFFYSKSQEPIVIDPQSPVLTQGENIQKAPAEKVIVVEFADFECPACAIASPYVKNLRAEYADKVTFIYKTFPLHSYSLMSTKAAFAVRDLTGKPENFFAMGDLIFEKQKEWEAASNTTGNQLELFASYAETFGVDKTKFKEIVNSDKYEDIIAKEKEEALSIGVNATPSFFINGKLVRGANIQQVKTLIDEELAR